MIKLNDNNIFIGYIKEFLKDVNLPDCYFDRKVTPTDQIYISGNSIFKKGEFEDTYLNYYDFNNYYPNFTKNLEIRNLIYDRYTHRFLGKYLEFIKAYKNIDLMCLYNYFDQEVLNDEISFINDNEKEIIFGNKLSNFITYKVPINKLSTKKYSIYLQSTFPTETIVLIDNYYDTVRVNQELVPETYKKLNINKSYLLDLSRYFDFNELDDSNIIKNALKHDASFYLLIKVPKSLKSNIVILSDDYITNQTIINREDNKTKQYAFSYNINPQLCNYRNDNNYLLSDKIISYLTGNAITPLSKDYDIEKMQRYLINNNYKINQNKSKTLPENKDLEELYNDTLGYWSSIDSEAIKQVMLNNIFTTKEVEINLQNDGGINFLPEYFDRLPYVDSDIEIIMHDNISETEHKKLTGEI